MLHGSTPRTALRTALPASVRLLAADPGPEIMPERRTVPAEAIGGWLSPTGDYWPCADWQHTRVAEWIIAELMIPRGRHGTALENHGWVHIDDDGTVLDDDHDVYTQAQLDYMFDLARAHPSMRDNLMAALERQRQRSATKG